MADDKKIDENKDKDFSKRTNQLIALTALVLAICATFASLYAGANASKGILAQNQVSDGWAYYQAKGTRKTIYSSQLEILEIDPPANPDPAKLEELKKDYMETIERYDKERDDIKADTQAKEKERDHFLELNKGFAGSLTYLQIAILLVSLAGLMKQIYFWYAGIAIGAFGVFNFVQAMMMV